MNVKIADDTENTEPDVYSYLSSKLENYIIGSYLVSFSIKFNLMKIIKLVLDEINIHIPNHDENYENQSERF